MTDMSGPASKLDREAQPVEALARMSRRALLLILAAIVILGGTAIAMAVAPASLLARWPAVAPWLIPAATFIAYITFRVRGGGRRSDPGADRQGASLAFPLRQQRLARAQRAALIATVSAQIPLALLMKNLPAQNSVMGMATATMTIGMAALVAGFLVFDR